MNPFQAFLHLLADPNIAFILFTLGFYGLIFELQNPNFVTGILGAFAIILAFIGFGSLPLNIAGLLLIGLAIVLFVLELTVTSHGLLAIGGLVAFVLGASALYTEPGDADRAVRGGRDAHHRDHDRRSRRCSWASCCGPPSRTRRMPPVNMGVRRRDVAPCCRSARRPRCAARSCRPGPSMLRARSGPHGARTAAASSAARRCGSSARMAWC